MKSKIYFLFAAFTAVIFSILFAISCKKDSKSDVVQTTILSQSDQKEQFKKVAKIFNATKSSSEMKNNVINTYKKVGIEEFLLHDFLKTNKSSGVTSRSLTSVDELEAIDEANPMITIAYPSFAFFNESIENHLSKIDYTVILFDDIENVKALEAYDANGNLTTISTQFDQSKRYCVIKFNEGKMAVNMGNKTTFFGDAIPSSLSKIQSRETIGKYEMYTAADFLNATFADEGNLFSPPSDPVSPRGGGPCSSERDILTNANKKEELDKVRWSSRSCVTNFESGFHLPQLEMIAVYAIPRYNNSTASVDLVAKDVFINWRPMTPEFSDGLGLELATWTADLGDRWQVLWIERDYWNKVQDKFTLGFSAQIKIDSNRSVGATLSWEITSMKQDKEIGRSLIERCDKATDGGTTYKPMSCDGSGGFFFTQHFKQ